MRALGFRVWYPAKPILFRAIVRCTGYITCVNLEEHPSALRVTLRAIEKFMFPASAAHPRRCRGSAEGLGRRGGLRPPPGSKGS